MDCRSQERETLSGRSAAVEMLPRFFHASNAPKPTTSINSLTRIPRVAWPTTIIHTNTKQDETPNPNPTERQHLSARSDKIPLSLGHNMETMRNPIIRGGSKGETRKALKQRSFVSAGVEFYPETKVLKQNHLLCARKLAPDSVSRVVIGWDAYRGKE